MFRGGLALVCASLLLGLGAMLYAARAEHRFAQQALALRTISPDAVARAARVLKLVTVEVTDVVRLQATDPSTFRPNVEASVSLPVRLAYGVDLSAMDASWVRVQLPPESVRGLRLSGVQTSKPIVVVRVPRPKRLAAEPLLLQEQADVTRSFLRFGEDAFLDKLRVSAAQAATQLELGPKEQARVDELTKAQVQLLIRAIVQDEADVVVEFVE
jgi:hypothetical protein